MNGQRTHSLQRPLAFVAGLLCFTALCLTAPTAHAQPETSQIEGVMLGTGGVAGADGNYTLTFSLYDKDGDGQITMEEMSSYLEQRES